METTENSQQGYMARDQYGETYHMYNCKYPRKWLLGYFGRKHAEKMYTDTKDGNSLHIGWIIAGHWLSVFRVFSLK